MSFFIKHWIVTLAVVGKADRPKDFAAIMDELITPADGSASPTQLYSCANSVLDSIEDTMGAKSRQWIERQVPIFEAALQPLFLSLPSQQGQLSQHVARYALHRVFVDERGWFIKSLEESDLYSAPGTASPTSVLQKQVPSRVEQKFHTCFKDGVCVKELAVLAATLDSLVHHEVLERVIAVFKAHKLPLFGSVRMEQMDQVLEQVMMSYILEEAGSPHAIEASVSGNVSISDRYPNWVELRSFLRNIEGIVRPSNSKRLKFDDLMDLVHELQVHFGRWQDGECQEQKVELHRMEIQECAGHVNLRDFYAANLYQGKWQFSESMEYLRVVGALEESQPDSPRVILANYVQGPNNCVASSRYYSQCCLNPCSSHLSKLEKAVAAPEVSPELLKSAVVAVLPKPDAQDLWDRLWKIAQGGKVTLHGAPFAEWLHRAYPQDCPAPLVGSPKQERPREYMARTGLSTDFPEEEMRSFVEQRPAHDEGVCELKWRTWDVLHQQAPSRARYLLATKDQAVQVLEPWASVAGASGGVAILLAMMCFLRGAARKECKSDFLATGS